MDLQDEMKKKVAVRAAQLVQPGMVVGLGSGSTAALLIADIGRRLAAGELADIRGVPTSFQASVLAQQNGIPLTTLNEVDTIAVAIDGADEVDPQRNLIKGGGGCHTAEKLVDARAERFVVVVDSTKISDRLGALMPVPVEVLPVAYRQVAAALRELGGVPDLRMAVRKAGPVVTDQGNFLLDTRFDRIDEPAALEARINNIPGVLDNGLFVGLADSVLVGEIVDGEAVVREL